MKSHNIFTLILVALLTSGIGSNIAHAYDNQNMHPAINQQATIQSNLSVFLESLGFSEGLNPTTQFKRYWLRPFFLPGVINKRGDSAPESTSQVRWSFLY